MKVIKILLVEDHTIVREGLHLMEGGRSINSRRGSRWSWQKGFRMLPKDLKLLRLPSARLDMS
jgi:hypothetical protein